MRDEQLKTLTSKLLARLNPPRAVAQNAEAMRSEAESIIKAVGKLAPTRNYTEWFDDFEDAVFGNLETRSWPTIRELQKAAKQIAPKRPEFNDLTKEAEGWKPDLLKVNAQRIKNGEPVCESYVVGKQADQILSLGYVTQQEIMPYRKYLDYWSKQ